MTENWFALLARPAEVLGLLDRLEGAVGLCVDFGNWGGAAKYEDLAAILPRRHTVLAGAGAGLVIAAFDLGVVGRRIPPVRTLDWRPQALDHLAYGAVVGSVLSHVRR